MLKRLALMALVFSLAGCGPDETPAYAVWATNRSHQPVILVFTEDGDYGSLSPFKVAPDGVTVASSMRTVPNANFRIEALVYTPDCAFLGSVEITNGFWWINVDHDEHVSGGRYGPASPPPERAADVSTTTTTCAASPRPSP